MRCFFFCMDKNREWEKNKKDATIHFKCCIFAHITYIGGFSITLERIEKIFFLMCRLKCF